MFSIRSHAAETTSLCITYFHIMCWGKEARALCKNVFTILSSEGNIVRTQWFLDVLAKLPKANFSFVMYVRLSVRPRGTTRLALDWFNKNLVFEDSSKKCKKILVSLIADKNVGTLHEDHYTLLITSRSFLLRMGNVSDKSCRENHNTHFVFSNFLSFFLFSKIVQCMRKCGKILCIAVFTLDAGLLARSQY